MDAKEALCRNDVWRCNGCWKIYVGVPPLESSAQAYCASCINTACLPCMICGNPQKTSLRVRDTIMPICSYACEKKVAKRFPSMKTICKCGEESSLRCGKCMLEKYCSSECQKADWKRHKYYCDKRCDK